MVKQRKIYKAKLAIVDKVSDMSEKLCKYLIEFDYKTQDILPSNLLSAVNAGEIISCLKNGGQLVLSQKQLFFENQALRAELVNNKGYTDESKIPALYVSEWPIGENIYFDPITGKRLGDELGINTRLFEK